MAQSNRELWYSFLAILLIGLIYIVFVVLLRAIPPARELFGHTLGILGFLLMLMTEILYTLRKRSKQARWGRMSSWLQFHIFTGLVGPYMVLLHTSWKFNGLAGWVTLLTLVVVASGFIGRYIYTSVPRTMDGVELEADIIEKEITRSQVDIDGWLATRPQFTRTLASRIVEEGRVDSLFGRIAWGLETRRMAPETRQQAQTLLKMSRRRRLLNRQLSSLAFSRRLLAVWHAVHIPIGMALFAAAFIHIGAALYYATFLR